MSNKNNLTDHEVYDSFFATEKEKKEINGSKISRGILAFFICVLAAIFFSFLEGSIFGRVGALFNICISAAFIVFFRYFNYNLSGYGFAIASVLLAALSLYLSLAVENAWIESIDSSLGLPFAIADISLILGISYILNNKFSNRKNTSKLRIGLVIIVGIGCLMCLATYIIETVFAF